MPPPLARYFDSVIPWETRLKREMPLLEELARKAGGRVLVPACGTGGHVVGLAECGFEVLGFDIDEDALAIARQKIVAATSTIVAASGKAEVRLMEMTQAPNLGRPYDVAFVLGNALPGMTQPGQLLAALRGVAGALRPGGMFLTQNLNYDLRWREKAQFFPVLAGQTKDEEVLLVRFADYDAEFISFHGMFLARPKTGGGWQSYVRSSRQIPLFRERLTTLLVEARFGDVTYWGDFARTPFEPDESIDLVVLARKQV
jgi:SAM-dependent methyltransferase